jgi:hypothetical protein
MDDYEFKSAFSEAAEQPKVEPILRKLLMDVPSSLLSWDDVEKYRPLDPANARLRHMLAHQRSTEAWRLLWLPPALPYYRHDRALGGEQVLQFTKRLVFSSWQGVPKVVAAVLSYEAERLMFGERGDVERPNTEEERKKLSRLLRFDRRDGRLTGMPLLGLMYPSIALAEIGDPLEICRLISANGLPEPSRVLELVAERIRATLEELPELDREGSVPDENWYWAAGALLDLRRYPGETRRWFAQPNLADVWRTEKDETEPDDDTKAADGWTAHVAELIRAASGQLRLGPRPADLPEVLAKIAVGAPGVVALRALSRICGGATSLRAPSIRNNAGWIAWGFRTLFNLPEVTAMLRRKAPGDYWRLVLDFCVTGGLQAVMDEYAHVLEEWEGVANRSTAQAARAVARRAAQALQLRTATVGLDAISADQGRLQMTGRRMRARYAARFGAQQTDEGAGAVRADDVRAAFNSPFWPFVLCSTSVGQEGLDFHLYCHAVVHWNLPSNPVDLEQREGRVHRYKGHAIRKNAAMLFGGVAMDSDTVDPWRHVFEAARDDQPEESSDLFPYWILPAEGGARIERHVPALPLSKDVQRAEALRKALTIYRMAFGQNRQEDIVAYLASRFSADEMNSLAESLRVDLAPLRRRYDASSQITWTRPTDEDELGLTSAAPQRADVTLAAAESLLNAYAAQRLASAPPGIERYQDLLDRFAALKG